MAASTSTSQADRRQASANSLTAALSRSLASSASFYFSRPIRLFRPTKVSMFTAMQALAQERGKTLSPSVVRGIVKEEGWRFLPKHVFPPFLANTLIGFTLFLSYTTAEAILSLRLLNLPENVVPFIAGACAGTAQAVISSPLDNIRMLLSRKGNDVVPKFHWISLLREALFPVFIVGHPAGENVSRIGQLRSLKRWATRGWSLYALSLVRDSLGFACFFGIFELGRKYAKRGGVAVDNALKGKSGWPEWLTGSTAEERKRRGWIGRTAQALILIAGGTLAGASYGLIGRPFDIARREIWHGRMQWASEQNLKHTSPTEGAKAAPSPSTSSTASASPPRSRLARLFGSSFLKRRSTTPSPTLPTLPTASSLIRASIQRDGYVHFFRSPDSKGGSKTRLDSHPALGGTSVYSGTASRLPTSTASRIVKVFTVIPPYSLGLLVYAVASGDLSI